MPLALSKSAFLAEAAKLYDTLNVNLDSHSQNFYDYEAQYIAHLQDFTKEFLAQSISTVPEDSRKKKDTE